MKVQGFQRKTKINWNLQEDIKKQEDFWETATELFILQRALYTARCKIFLTRGNGIDAIDFLWDNRYENKEEALNDDLF